MIVLRNILVATDFSETSDAALRYGRDLARTFGATLHLLNVAPNVMASFATDALPAVLPDVQRQVEEAARQQLEALLDPEDRTQLHAKPVVRTSLTAAAEIVEYAREAGIDLIVIGTHGRGAMAHVLMGSVAERVVRTAPCPVLTVRHPEREFVLPDALVAVVRSSDQGIRKQAANATRVVFAAALVAAGMAPP